MPARFMRGTGALAQISADLGLSQVVSIPANARTIITSGQVGFREDLTIPEDVGEQVRQIAHNAHKLLQDAGATEGLKAIYHVTIYMTNMSDDNMLTAWKEVKSKYDIKSVETGVTVPSLYQGAKVEMTFYALGGCQVDSGKL